MVLHTSTVTMSWRFHSDQSPAYTGKQQIPQVPLLGKGLSGCFTALWFCTGFLPTLFLHISTLCYCFWAGLWSKGLSKCFPVSSKKGDLSTLDERPSTWEQGTHPWRFNTMDPPTISSPHLILVHSSPFVHLLSARAFRRGNLSNFSFMLLPHDPW